jgi:hypothetical protein
MCQVTQTYIFLHITFEFTGRAPQARGPVE